MATDSHSTRTIKAGILESLNKYIHRHEGNGNVSTLIA